MHKTSLLRKSLCNGKYSWQGPIVLSKKKKLTALEVLILSFSWWILEADLSKQSFNTGENILRR